MFVLLAGLFTCKQSVNCCYSSDLPRLRALLVLNPPLRFVWAAILCGESLTEVCGGVNEPGHARARALKPGARSRCRWRGEPVAE